MPRIDDMINNLAHYKVFSTFYLRNAFHQVPIVNDDRKYTGFEANGGLYQFRRIHFEVTNGVAVFQRLMDNIINAENPMIRPDPERLRPIKELALPTNVQSLRRTLVLFAYYAKWIPEFSSKIPSKIIPSANSG